jgi:opacity protein-like surface antigen
MSKEDKMKRSSVFLSLAILCIFLLTTAGNTQDFLKKFSLKFSGGMGSTAGGDFNAVPDGMNSISGDLVPLLGLTKTGNLENPKWGLDFEAELIFSLSRNFGVGIGVGYLKRSKDSSLEMALDPLGRATINWEPEFSLIPITLSSYYSFPISSKMNTFLKAGIGYYFVKVSLRGREEYESFFGMSGWEEEEGEAKDNGVGFHGGLGFEYNMTGSIALYAEGMGRYLKIKDWQFEGTTTYSSGVLESSGTVWYTEELLEPLGKYYPGLQILEQKPFGPNYRNVRKAAIDLSGFSFRVGIRIRFGK